jgi:predicted metal-dependent HD superfamily phosphohydrolase
MNNQTGNVMATDWTRRFVELCQRVINPNTCFNNVMVCQNILHHYAIPGRHYHNLNHLGHCLEEFDQVRHLIPNPDAVEMALWFHDSIYIPGKPDNEQKSAAFFLMQSQSCFPRNFEALVEQLIMATTHRDIPKNADECFIVDIDLSSFGFEWETFHLDSQHLREEQKHVPTAVYFQGHGQFLKMLLARERIFHTDIFYQRYERIAIENIGRLLNMRQLEGFN